MKRREFILALGGAAAWPLTAGAQQGERARRVGVLLPYNEQDARWAFFTTFKERLAELGAQGGRPRRPPCCA